MIIISLSGKKRAGKNTIAEIISEILMERNSPLAFHSIGFADALYDEVATMLLKVEGSAIVPDLVANKIRYIQKPEHKELFRPLLQWWGTEFRRKIGKDDSYWLRKLAQLFTRFSQDSLVVVTDTRFLNEAELLKHNGAHMWRVMRPATEFKELDTHASECELDNYKQFEMHFINDGTKKDLRIRVELALEPILNAQPPQSKKK